MGRGRDHGEGRWAGGEEEEEEEEEEEGLFKATAMNEVGAGRGGAMPACVRLEEGLFKGLNSLLWMR
jgi:hypothetical protein